MLIRLSLGRWMPEMDGAQPVQHCARLPRTGRLTGRRTGRWGAWLGAVGLVAALLSSASAAWAQSAAEAIEQHPSPAGPALAMGGSVRADNAAVWGRLVELAGGPGSRIAVLAMAAGNPERVAAQARQTLERAGAVVEVVAVAPALAGQDVTQEVRNPKWIEVIRQSQAVFFTGGAQERIVDTLAPAGRPTPLLEAIVDLQKRGGLIAGTSAGAAVMSAVMFRDAPFVTSVLKGQLRPGKEFDRGLGFVGGDLFVDQHFIKRGRIGRMIPLMLAQGMKLGVGVEENSAVLIHREHLEVVGGRGALVVDLQEASSRPVGGAFAVQGVRVSYLEPGDRFELASRQAVPAKGKAGNPINSAAPNFEPTYEYDRFFMDILGDNAIFNAMVHLVDGKRNVVRGLAYRMIPGEGDTRPDMGFEFRLSRDARTRAWFTFNVGSEGYTVTGVRLDITPVRMTIPLYEIWKEP